VRRQPLRLLCALAALVPILPLVACREDGRGSHAFGSPPPVPATAPVAATVLPAAELPLGTRGPEARIANVADAATGRPVSLTDMRDSVEVLALFSLGPYPSVTERVTIQLVLRGACDEMLSIPFEPPAPVIIAHQFRVPLGAAGGGGMRDGACTLEARLLDARGKTLAASVPVHFTNHR
jgi:hypothetical protein